MTPSDLLFCYVAILLAALAWIALLSEIRRRRFGPRPTDDNLFRCENCAFVYTDDPTVERSRCPQCGSMNSKFNF